MLSWTRMRELFVPSLQPSSAEFVGSQEAVGVQ